MSTKPIIALGAIAIAVAIIPARAFAVMVTIHNDAPRLDQTYYLYGTASNNQNGFSFSNRFVVYSSPDLTTWTFHGDITTVMLGGQPVPFGARRGRSGIASAAPAVRPG